MAIQKPEPKACVLLGEELNIGNKKEAAALCAGKFIIELGELNFIRRNELNAMKQYLTDTHDTYQPKYKQKAVTVPRMHIFGGSTNEETFLTDPTGNRRFWCVTAGDKVIRNCSCRSRSNFGQKHWKPSVQPKVQRIGL